MMYADEVFGKGFIQQLADEVDAGYIRTQVHPIHPLTIYNYTEQAVFDRQWNRATLNARGLILNHEGMVVARPFRKFFNYGEPDATVMKSDDKVLPFDKLDGSLGILYWTPDDTPAIATRGSFTSDQALHATEVLTERYLKWANNVHRRWPYETFMFEIVYPENRIVVDYEGMDDLVMLGSQDMRTGDFFIPKTSLFEGPKAESFGVKTLAEALALPPRPGKEGLVLYHYDTGDRVKVKQEDYLRLHRIVTNLNERAVWEILKDRKDSDAWIAELPDEFHGWARDVRDRIISQYREIYFEIDSDFHRIYQRLEEDAREAQTAWTRRGFADLAKTTKYPWALFAKLDYKDYSAKVWDLVKPEANKTPHSRVDTAG